MPIMFDQPAITSNLTADGVIGTSGSKTSIVSITVKGGSATTRALIYDGTSTSGTLRVDIIAPIDNTIPAYYGPKGSWYQDGAYLDITTTGGAVSVTYFQSTD